MSEREKTLDKKEDTLDEQQEIFTKKLTENEQHKRQESRMMNFFNQEFLDRKIDFKPK
jgi:hypothetical protein